MIKPILAQYIPIAHMIAKTVGDDCEVVLHDLENPQQSVVYTVNNCVTGRQVGQSFDHLVPQVILSKKLDHDVVTNYYFRTEDGRLVKSSTALLKDFAGKVVGALCINIDTSKITAQIDWLQSLIPSSEDNSAAQEVSAEEEVTHVSEIVTDLIDKIIGDKDVARLRREEKLELIRFMDQRGIFLMKGAVDQVGSRMGISRVTVYSYIDEVRGKK
ncbi:helix-turn-helix transcriptional regulator [Angelakisella massiliensis]|uniref:helix-turn-helix transcriptional regulator n=1 Tax=Angelakisella massiliensis TaxID=1871018 RepID=UPI0008F89AB6|nr:PAS domain-containing protein [Angelakisella massiliensis]